MRIGILTLPLHTNYGGILQAWALQTVLERMGHEVDVLDYRHNSKWFYPGLFFRRIILKAIGKYKGLLFAEKKAIKSRTVIQKYTDLFVSKRIKRRTIPSLNVICENDYDTIIVGSDQVWRKPYFCWGWQSPISDAYLSFTRGWNIKRIAFAASFGLDDIHEYTSEDSVRCKDAIKFFDAVSVREDTGIRLCREVFSLQASQVLDPTMLLDKDDYLSLLGNIAISDNVENLICYILDSNKQKDEIISRIAEIKGLKPHIINADVNNKELELKYRIQPPVENWLKSFLHTDFIITDSFHACVFAILFKKQFVVLGNKERGLTRITSLLRLFGIDNRIMYDNTERIPEDYDVERVQTILKQKRYETIKWLSESCQL